jgi:hypothetical protein
LTKTFGIACFNINQSPYPAPLTAPTENILRRRILSQPPGKRRGIGRLSVQFGANRVVTPTNRFHQGRFVEVKWRQAHRCSGPRAADASRERRCWAPACLPQSRAITGHLPRPVRPAPPYPDTPCPTMRLKQVSGASDPSIPPRHGTVPSRGPPAVSPVADPSSSGNVRGLRRSCRL